MPSTFTSSGGIQKPGTGELSGEWGTVTNTNFDIIDRLVNGVTSISLGGYSVGSPYPLTTSDGELSPGQFLVITFTGAGAAVKVNIVPQDATKVYFIKNSSGYTVTMAQGTGATVDITNGASKLIYSNGLGATAAVFDFTSFLSMSSPTLTGGTITGGAISGGTISGAAITGGTITGAGITGSTLTGLTPSRALVSDASGNAVVATTTLAEIGYVNLVTSPIQAQLNLKAPLAIPVFTGQVSFDDGTAALPSITNTGDTNTGIFFPTADSVGIATAGVEAMRIDSSGKVSFVDGTAAAPSITNTGDTNTGIYFPAADTVGISTAGTEAVRVDSSGNVGIGATATARLTVADGTTVTTAQIKNTSVAASVSKSTTLQFLGTDTGGTVKEAGSVVVVPTDSAYTGSTMLFFTRASNVIAEKMRISDAGDLTIVGTTATKASGSTWSNPSDQRLKTNIMDYAKGIAELMQVRVREWEYNGKGGTTEGMKGLGVIADEVMTILPDTVENYDAHLNAGDADTTAIKRFDATEIIWLLVKAVQEQQTAISALEARLSALEARA
jgi:hypothetical protein